MTNLKNKSRIFVIIFDFLLLVFLFSAKFIAKLMIDILPDCPLNMFSLQCPSCGATRAVYNLFSGNILIAFKYNQFFFLLSFYLIFIIIFLNLGYVFNIDFAKKIFIKATNYKIIIALAFLWLLFGIIRNIF